MGHPEQAPEQAIGCGDRWSCVPLRRATDDARKLISQKCVNRRAHDAVIGLGRVTLRAA